MRPNVSPEPFVAVIPAAYHHVIVDDPEAFARAVLGWSARFGA